MAACARARVLSCAACSHVPTGCCVLPMMQVRPSPSEVDVHYCARSAADVEEAVALYGAAPGGKAMMRQEALAAQEACETGVYITWRSSVSGAECARVASSSRCFCGHKLADHQTPSRTNPQPPRCAVKSCTCQRFDFVPSRPEEVGMWWLPRRKGFDVRTWRAQCECKHGHDEHDPRTRRCRQCGCPCFRASYRCIGCEGAPTSRHLQWPPPAVPCPCPRPRPHPEDVLLEVVRLERLRVRLGVIWRRRRCVRCRPRRLGALQMWPVNGAAFTTPSLCLHTLMHSHASIAGSANRGSAFRCLCPVALSKSGCLYVCSLSVGVSSRLRSGVRATPICDIENIRVYSGGP